ncbi:MAG: signal peptidase I, partial [Jatrophihabitans sp.]
MSNSTMGEDAEDNPELRAGHPATTGSPAEPGAGAPAPAAAELIDRERGAEPSQHAVPPGSGSATEPVDPSVASAADASDPSGQSTSERAGARRRKMSRFELPILIVVAIAIAIVLKTFVVQPFFIPSASMEKTLHGCTNCAGDRILVFKPVYHVRDPHPGDIVVFKAPQDWDELAGVTLSSNPVAHAVQWFGQLVGVVPPSEKDLVKRVIAIGGQTVRCCDDNGNVQISDNGSNGPWRSLTEPYIFENSSWSKSATPGLKSADDTRSFGPVTVPKGRLWVMGDHRGDSADSRYHCGDTGSGPNCDPVSSTVPVSDVIGKSVVIAWPPSRWRTLGTPKTFT